MLPIKNPTIIGRLFKSVSNIDIKTGESVYLKHLQVNKGESVYLKHLQVNKGEQIIIYEALGIPSGYFYAVSDKDRGLIPSFAVEINGDSYNPYMFLLNILCRNNCFLLKLIFPLFNHQPEKFTKLIMLTLLRRYILFDTVESLLREEIAKTDETMIFRDTSLVLSIVKNILHTPRLKKFKENVTKPLVQDLIKNPESYTTEQGWENRLVKRISKFIDTLIGQPWPNTLHCIFKSIKNSTNNTELTHRIINTVIFLYFLNPAIINPSGKITNTQQKALILCAKILQAIANDTVFEESSSFAPFNIHIKKWRKNIERLLSVILRLKKRRDSELKVAKITESQMVNVLTNIHFLVCQKKQDILSMMYENTSLYVEFNKILDELGPPAKKLAPFENSNTRMDSPIIPVLKRRKSYVDNITQGKNPDKLYGRKSSEKNYIPYKKKYRSVFEMNK